MLVGSVSQASGGLPSFRSVIVADSSDVPVDNEDDQKASVAPPRGPDRRYARLRTFSSVSDFKAWWREEKKKWNEHEKVEQANEFVMRFRCKHYKKKGYRCTMALRVSFPHDDDTVEVDTSGSHDHEPKSVAELDALTDEVKAFVREKMTLQLTAGRIHVLLSKQPFHKQPSLKQVQNFIYRENDAKGGPFTDADFKSHCREHFSDFSGTEESNDSAHVAKWHFNSVEDFCMLWTSKALLEKQLASPFIQVDSTYKTNYFSYPVQIVGYSDVNRRFHPTLLAVGPSETAKFYSDVMQYLADLGYEPTVVLADGSAAISKAIREIFPRATRAMCYAHAKRQAKKRAAGRGVSEFREEILADIELIRYARSDAEFSMLANEMLDSWPREFADYFRSTWVDSEISLWYEAATPFCMTNNGLERTNRDVKENQTLRRKWPFPQWLACAKGMVAYWSSSSEEVPLLPTVKPALFKTAYQMSAGDGKRRVIKSADQDLYIVAGSGKTFSSDQELWDYYVEHRTATSWAHFVETRFMVHVIKPSPVAGHRHYLCSCSDGSRKRMCAHSVLIMCSEELKLYAYPPDAKAVPLAPAVQGRKKKPGRPTLAPKQNRYAIA
ncbi:hypothetical protein AAVH_19488 [Aphelenchoides avenae]|nr:hypothetical protein AAVH_19488 [Aphelenchus avenae]